MKAVDPTRDRTRFYKGFVEIWQDARSRDKAERKLTAKFPEEEITRSRMMRIRWYMVEKKGIPLKEIPADSGTNWDEVLSYANNL